VDKLLVGVSVAGCCAVGYASDTATPNKWEIGNITDTLASNAGLL
jgi:hypothetical protein